MTAEQIQREACPHGEMSPCRACDRYWWHEHIAREVARLTGECGLSSANVPAIAGNLRGMTQTDCERYVAQMVAWGELVASAAAFEFEATWVRLA